MFLNKHGMNWSRCYQILKHGSVTRQSLYYWNQTTDSLGWELNPCPPAKQSRLLIKQARQFTYKK